MAMPAINAFHITNDANCPTCADEDRKTANFCRLHAWCSKRWFETLRLHLPLSTLPTPHEDDVEKQ